MKHFLSMLAVVFTVGLATVSVDADAAKRMGSGKSMGTQRQAAPEKPAATQAPATPAPAAAAGSSGRSWMAPVAGLAAGLGLAALASHFGFGEELANMVLMGLMVVAIMAVVGWFLRKRAMGAAGTPQAPAGMQYAHVNPAAQHHAERSLQDAPSYKALMPAQKTDATHGSSLDGRGGLGIGSGLAPAPRWPAGFDAQAFESHARSNFLRLQAAHDAGRIEEIRSFTTPALYAELAADMAQREPGIHRTEVPTLDVEVIDVEEGTEQYTVSVRFSGVMRDLDSGDDEAFDEVWHLTKPRYGDGGWLLGGIQQMV